jgi:hypothetical protein
MTVDLASLPAVGQTFTASGLTLQLRSVKPTLQNGNCYEMVEIGRRGQPKKVTYLATDASRGACTMIRI